MSRREDDEGRLLKAIREESQEILLKDELSNASRYKGLVEAHPLQQWRIAAACARLYGGAMGERWRVDL